MATSTISMNRLTGLATGLDTDTLVKQLMQAERVPLDKLTQKKQTLEWQRDAYRNVTNLLRGFQDEFFNTLKNATNVTSKNAFYKYTSTVSDTSIVSVSANADAKAGSHTLKVNQLAKAASATGSSVSAPLKSAEPVGLDFTDGNNRFNITVDGVTKRIDLRMDAAYADYNDLVENGTYGIQKLVDDAFGAGKVDVSVDGSGYLTFASTTGTSRITLTSPTTLDAMDHLNFTSGASNKINTSDTLANLAGKFNTELTFDDDAIDFTINDVRFRFSKNTTLKTVMNTVNNSNAGVEMTYNELTDSFSLTAKQTGAGNAIVVSNQAGNFFGASAASSAVGIATGPINNGKDAIIELDGISNITRSTNNIIVDGVTYTLNKEDPSTTVTIGITQDVDAVYDNIKSFVDKYNELIGKLNGVVDEEKDRDYQPLTDAQKEEMSDDEITNWETAAKTGLLSNDPTIQKVVRDMRQALADTVSGISGTLNSIGISTGTYDQKGKLIIDETKLKAAITNTPDKVSDLFAKTSSIDYSADLSSSDRSKRYKEEGMAQRLYDVLRDNIRLTRDKSGYKGTLIEKAGYVGDASEFSNILDKQIDQTDTKIDELTDKLNDRETYYYNKFAALEQAISKLNQQSSWLAQQLGTSTSS